MSVYMYIFSRMENCQVALLPVRTAVRVALSCGRLWVCGWRDDGDMAAVGKQQQAETEAQQQRQHQVVVPVRHLQNKPRQRLRYLMCRTKNE